MTPTIAGAALLIGAASALYIAAFDATQAKPSIERTIHIFASIALAASAVTMMTAGFALIIL